MSELAEVTWDLEDLLGDHAAERPEDAVGALLDEAEREAGDFAERYEGKVADKVERIEPEQVDTEKVKATLRLIHGNTG